MTVAKGQKGDAGAVFDLAPNVGLVSDRRAANGWVMACVKKAKKNNLTGKKGGCFSGGKKGHAKRGWGYLINYWRGAARLARFMPGPGVGMNRDGRASRLRSLGNFKGRECNGAFGLTARVGESGARISGQTKERRGTAAFEICQGSVSEGECESDRFQGVVCQGN